tara:strand:+ start:102 stop:434 length:333 start_codon:yes stop_codon:yes gene_type:complete
MADTCPSPETLLSEYVGIGLPEEDNTWFIGYIKTKNKRSSTRTIYSTYGHIVIKSSDLQIVGKYLQEIEFCKCINKLNNQKGKTWSYHYIIFPNIEQNRTTVVIYRYINI